MTSLHLIFKGSSPIQQWHSIIEDTLALIATLVWLLPKQQQQAGSNTTKWPEFVPNQSWAAHGGDSQPPSSHQYSHKVCQIDTDTAEYTTDTMSLLSQP